MWPNLSIPVAVTARKAEEKCPHGLHEVALSSARGKSVRRGRAERPERCRYSAKIRVI